MVAARDGRPWRRRLALPALILVLALLVPVAAVAGARFADVRAGQTHASAIGWAADMGITGGCDPAGTRYCPTDPVTRAQMATFMHRLAGYGGTGPSVDAATVDGYSPSDLVRLVAPMVTRGVVTGTHETQIVAADTFRFVRQLGTFDKEHDFTRLEATFNTHVRTSANNTCVWQLRVAGRNANHLPDLSGASAYDGHEQLVYGTGTFTYAPLTFSTEFHNTPAGPFTLQLWVASPTTGHECFHNPGNYPRAWRVVETR